jgi:hypothetical protein
MEFTWVTKRSRAGHVRAANEAGTMSVYTTKKGGGKDVRLSISIRRDIVTTAGMSSHDFVQFGYNSDRLAIKISTDGKGARLSPKVSGKHNGSRLRCTFCVTSEFPECFRARALAVPILDVQTGPGIIMFSARSADAWANSGRQLELIQGVSK